MAKAIKFFAVAVKPEVGCNCEERTGLEQFQWEYEYLIGDMCEF